MRYYPKSSPGPAFLANRRAATAVEAPPAGAPQQPASPVSVPAQPFTTPAPSKISVKPSGELLRRVGLPFAVFFVFLRFSFLHEILVARLGVNMFLLLIVGTIVTVGALISGGLQRTFFSRPAQFWLLFGLWMLLDCPFSTWKMDSLNSVFQYFRVNLPMLFVIAGFALSLRDCYLMMSAIALAGVVNVFGGSEFVGDGSRLSLTFGSIANSNDYAAHLLMVLPFLLWVGVANRNPVPRIAAIGFVLAGIFIGAKSGSRGAMIALVAVAVFLVIRSRGVVRLLTLLSLPALAIGLILFLPHSLRSRYETLFENQANGTSEAEESFQSRQYLLNTSLGLTLHNPLFGVGPNEFLITEGGIAQKEGRHGAWMATHNSYTQVASEDGIPALIFFLGAIILTFRLYNRVYTKCANRPDLRRAQLGALCAMSAMLGFGVSILFLSLAYSMYLPAMTGLAIALNRAVDTHLNIQLGAPLGTRLNSPSTVPAAA